MNKTPRTDEADKFVTYSNKLDGKAYATEWVYASFAQDLEIELNELKKWKEEALKVMNQWNEVSDYINLNAEVEDLGRFVPQICLKYLKERDELILLEESIKVLTDERNRWHELFEEGVKQQREVEEQRDKALLIGNSIPNSLSQARKG